MTPWDLTGMDFDDIADMPSWALPQLTLDENCEFILQTPEEDEEVSLPDEMYDADDEETYPDLKHLSRRVREIREEEGPSFMQSFESPTSQELHQRIFQIRKRQAEEEGYIREQQSQARDSERPNFLSECPDYSQESSLRLDGTPLSIDFSGDFGQIARTENSSPMPDNEDQNSDNSKKFHTEFYETSPARESILVISKHTSRKGISKISAAPHRSPRIRVSTPAIHHDLLVVADNQNEETTSILPGFETMDVDEIIFDNENTPKYYPDTCSISDIIGPKHFDLEPHWFNDTSKTKCWCYHCIHYREIQSTGKQPEAHDFNKWCLCTSCMKYWHEVLAVGYVCNCPDCTNHLKAQTTLKESDEAQAISEEKQALATLRNQLQPPSTSQEPQESQQSPPKNPLCPDATTAASESQKLNSELFDIIRENLTLDHDSDSDE